MKHFSPDPAAETAQPVRAPTRRKLAKQQTRGRVLDAARRLFSEQGYEGATIRDIATAAGMSTGAVFANFTDKADLFRQIMADDAQSLIADMRQAGEGAGDVEAALVRMIAAGYAYYQRRAQLARAAFSVSWDREGRANLQGLQITEAIQSLFGDHLSAAMRTGALRPDVDVVLISEMLHDVYLSNFPRAIFEGWGLEAMTARSRTQVAALLAGARRTAA